MKKFFTLIIILIALIGIFSPILKVSAQVITPPSASNLTGSCSSGNPPTITQNTTQATCISPAVFTPDPLGNCIYSADGTPNGSATTGINYTKANCIAKGANATWIGYYNLLQPLPGIGSQFNPSNAPGQPATSLSSYLNPMINIFIGICAVLAVIMILFGGIQYMTSELISSKEEGKERIEHAVLGLLLSLGAWSILNTINPNLLKSDVNIPDANVTVGLTQTQQIANFTGSGTCSPVSSSSSPCSTTNLTSWGFVGGATEASSICNGESGGNPSQVSGVDVGSDGNAFSFGLFQVNALAHANDIIDTTQPTNSPNYKPCQGVWNINSSDPNAVSGYSSNNTKTLGSCLQLDKSGKICVKYSNTVVSQSQYNTCKNFLTNPTNNIAYAANLLDNTSWKSWGADASCHF